jgi:pimeloyl-ACP methyl ester carboxylesterase
LALTKRPAKDPQHRIGTVFTNPGGPGGGRIPPRLSPAIAARFDIVGFDPRGTDDSTPVSCSDDPADDERLTYLGTSYGTHLGEVYANLYPRRVRAMVLDGVLQPREWTTGRLPGQGNEPYIYRTGPYLGAQTALNTLLRECAAHVECEFGGPGATEASLHRKFDDLLATLRRGPVTLPDSQLITYQELVGRMLSALYGWDAAAYITPFLQAVYLATQHLVAASASVPESAPPPRFSPGAEEPDEPLHLFNTWFNAVA